MDEHIPTGAGSLLDLPRPAWTLTELVRARAVESGEAEFLSFDDGRNLTFSGLDRASDTIAAALVAIGVERGDRIAILGHNTWELVVTCFAAGKCASTFVPLNTELKGAFLDHQLRNAAPRVVVVDAELVSALATLDDVHPSVTTLAIVDAGDGPAAGATAVEAASPAFPCAEVTTFGTLAARPGANPRFASPSVGEIAMIMYTSGTTGPAKGVLMPHAHCAVFGLGLARAVAMSTDDHFYICMPLFHANALLMQLVGCLWTGTSATVVRRFSATRWLDDVRHAGATLTNALGVMPEFLIRQPPTDHDRDHRLRRIMAVPISEEWGADFEQRFGVELFQGYGMTECNMVAYSRPGDGLVPGCAGAVLDDLFEVRVVDPDTDEPMPVDEVGEIVVRPQVASCFMAGYDRMPDRTVEAWRNLWFHTGDAGRLDQRGRLHFVDRIRDRIRRRGENISSFEVEQVINSHPAVVESAVVGVPSDDGGGEDEVKAVVVVDGAFDPVSLLDHCQVNMPRHAVPRYVEVVAELDKTPTGKLRKQALRDTGVGSAWDREAVGYVVRR